MGTVKIKCDKTQKGLPALWERGGSYTNTGFSSIICNEDSTRKTPVYVKRSGTLMCSDHALFVLKKNDIIIDCSHKRRDFEISVYKVLEIKSEKEVDQSGDEVYNYYAYLETVAQHSLGEWDNDNMFKKYRSAIQAAKDKSLEYHCRRPYYIAM